ncbi:LuxR family transcriptional regulator [Sphingobium sp. CR2-8]|uniref:helix-turn-helix transcriptional regulator n=1 Tax=Sphingobium sp. CR2-8 TaxID=1306534 RepID=UPI002DB5FF49|nr:LuxR family transcriptional regulator [Sphingobium sp. CR2-8]MEC3909428.1 LuxR family transcriptional regulator [Sphingobium sp. CR2-8]
MSISVTYQRELALPLIEGIHESPPWGGLMRELVARTYARRAYLVINLANAAADQAPSIVQVAAPRATADPPLDYQKIVDLELHPQGRMRPLRVYSLDEMLDYGRPERLASQKVALQNMGIHYARFLRVTAGGAADAQMLLVREREDFSAAAVATLSSIAPHLTVALKTLAALIEQRLQVALAQSALQRLGIGQMAFDATGRVMAADTHANSLMAFAPEPPPVPGRRLQLIPAVSHALENACEAIASGRLTSVPLPLDTHGGLWILLRKADLLLEQPCAVPTAVGALRTYKRENAAKAHHAIAMIHNLSRNEASLAHQLSLGETIVDAGRNLRLTPETSRSYSKRIYAKTGASNQADLVRLILTGLAPLS